MQICAKRRLVGFFFAKGGWLQIWLAVIQGHTKALLCPLRPRTYAWGIRSRLSSTRAQTNRDREMKKRKLESEYQMAGQKEEGLLVKKKGGQWGRGQIQPESGQSNRIEIFRCSFVTFYLLFTILKEDSFENFYS